MEINRTNVNDDFDGRRPATPVAPPVTPEIAFENQTRESKRRAKSSLRLKYEAETQVIERKLGDLEAIRQQLGLSQRKIAQLLLVDPSAWTRWTKGVDQAPPHIYRMLQWYLALEEKYPALDVNFWLNTVAQMPATTALIDHRKIESVVDLQLRQRQLVIESRARDQFALLRADFEKRETSLRSQIRWMAIAATLAGCAIGAALVAFLRH
jgi:transcriptional regulator with XRE-family HTH domain